MSKKLFLIGTGGTISVEGSGPTDFLDYPVSGQRVPIARVLERLPNNSDLPEITCIDLPPTSSTEVGPKVWDRLMSEIDRVMNTAAGFVIAHGTGTMEETAFVLELFKSTGVPSVLTGAQRPLDALSSDALLNLWSALQVASFSETAAYGWLVVMNRQIHSAAAVSKQDNLSIDAFKSGFVGPLGSIEQGEVKFHCNSNRSSLGLLWRGVDVFPRVEVVMAYAGADGSAIEAAISAGARGVVVVGLAPGYATPSQRDALRTARRSGVEIVMASRASYGVTLGLAQNDIEGLIGSRRLSPAKARLLLAAAMMNHATNKEIDRLFQVFG